MAKVVSGRKDSFFRGSCDAQSVVHLISHTGNLKEQHIGESMKEFPVDFAVEKPL